jgi:cytochrome b
MRQVSVWDLATRLFHWLLVLFVVVTFVTGEDEGLVFAIHAYAGFVVLMLLLFRLGWGVFGSRRSRFADFIYPWSTVRRYAISLLRLAPAPYVGHNPLGGWMVVLMLAVLIVATLSGVLIVTHEADWLEEIHETLGTLMEVLVFIHIAGVLFDRLLTGEKLVRAMITGRKELSEELAKREQPLARTWRALALATVVVIASGYMFQQTDYSAKVAAIAANGDAGSSARTEND